MPRTVTVAVVGGGMAGLAAAAELTAAGARVVVLEASSRLGGKLRSSEVGGLVVDEGADAFLLRVPEAAELAAYAGVEVVSPATAEAGLWSRGCMRPLPTGTLLGIPADLASLARSEVLSARGLARVPVDLVLPGPPVVDDTSVGDLVTKRLGREVVERLVDPLLGGVYAGRADRISLHAALPQLVAPLLRHRSLLLAARDVTGAATGSGPVFGGVVGGMGLLPPAVARTTGAEVRLQAVVRGLVQAPTGWGLETGSAADPRRLDVDAVVLAVPAAAAAKLLKDVVPTAAAELATIESASVGIVTLVLDGPTPGRGSGYLVPAVDGRTTKAVTFTSRKWAHLAGDLSVVRASVGRHGEEVELQRDDAELVAVVRQELQDAVGPLPPLVDSRVTRWGGGLPQYAVGHVDKVGRVRRAVAARPGLAVAGAAYDGVGVPAVVRSGRAAARAVLASLTMGG